MNLKRTVAVLITAAIMIKSTTDVYAWTGYDAQSRLIDSKNDSQQLYRWVALDSETKQFEEFMPKVKDGLYRMLLCYYCEKDGEKGWYYYQADPSCFEHLNDNFGFSCVKATDTPQVKIGAKEFVTRGGLQAFYCLRTAVCNWDHKAYKGDYQYALYPCKPGTDERMANVSLYWCDGYCDEDFIWYYDTNGKGVGSTNNGDDNDKYKKSYAGGDDHSWWTLSMASDEVIRDGLHMFYFTPELNKSDDAHLTHVIKNKKQAFSASDNHGREYPDCLWAVYIGAPIGVESTKTENGKDIIDTSLGRNGQTEVIYTTMDAIMSPYLVKKGQKYTVEEDGVLFINDVVVVRGEIINRGLIILGNDGCIIELDDEDSRQRLKLEGGDLIVKKGAYIKLDEIIMEANGKTGRCPQLVNYGNILAKKKLSISDTIIDNGGEIHGGFYVLGTDLVAVNASKTREESFWRPHFASGFSLAADHSFWRLKDSNYSLSIGSGNKIIKGTGSKIDVGATLK